MNINNLPNEDIIYDKTIHPEWVVVAKHAYTGFLYISLRLRPGKHPYKVLANLIISSLIDSFIGSLFISS